MRLALSMALAAGLWAALAVTTPGAVLAMGGTSTSAPPAGKANVLDPAKAAIDKKDWSTAISLLTKVVATDNKNADAYNWLGYSQRKAGDPVKALESYKTALTIDPKHKGAHEYIGEAYLETNNLPLAEAHLKQLDSICSMGCDEARELKAAISAYKKKNNIS